MEVPRNRWLLMEKRTMNIGDLGVPPISGTPKWMQYDTYLCTNYDTYNTCDTQVMIHVIYFRGQGADSMIFV